MKNLILLIFTVLHITISLASSPEKMSYQAIIRNAENELLINQQVGIRISILKGSTDGISVYTETQIAATNGNGLITIEIGTGETTDNFSTINWSESEYFIKTETDLKGGSNYTITGVSQILSVPYALYAKEAGTISDMDKFVTKESLNTTITSLLSTIQELKESISPDCILGEAGMGAWTDIDKDIVYQAESDGFIYVSSKESNQCSGHVMYMLQGSEEDKLTEFYKKSVDMTFIVPVSKGSYFKLKLNVDSYCQIKNPSLIMKWLPLK